MATFGDIGGQEPSTINFRVGTVTLTRNSTVVQQEILCIGDSDSTIAVARVLNTTPASTTWALAVREVAPSTTVQVSSLAGTVTVAPASTVFMINAGLHFNSSGDLKVEASFTGSTTITISTVVGVVTVRAEASSNSSVYMPVKLVNGSAFAVYSQDYTDASTYSSLTGQGFAYNNGSNATFRVVGLTQPLPMQVTDSSNAGVKPGDSANNAVRVNVVAGSATSTTVNVSSVSGTVAVTPSGTTNSSIYLSVRLTDGTAFLPIGADYTEGSTYSSLVAPGLAYNNGSNATFRVVGLTQPLPVQMVRVTPTIITVSSTSAFAASTALTLMSSAASTAAYITAYSITTTNAGPTKLAFYSSGTMIWPISLAAVSGAIVGVNLAATPPGYLFKAETHEALSLRSKSSTVAGWHVAVSYYKG